MVRYLALLSALVLVAPASAQGLLFRTRRATFGKQRVASAPAASSVPIRVETDNGQPSGTSTEDLTLDEWVGLGVLGAIGATSPLWLPWLILEEDRPSTAYFPSYPYSLPNMNYLSMSNYSPSNEGLSPFDPEYLKVWGVRGGLEDGYCFNSVNRIGGRASIDTTSRFGLTTNWDHYYELLPNGRSDELVIGDLEATFRFAQSDFMQMHIGLGGRGLFSQTLTRGGFNMIYSADIYPIDPLVISASTEVGNINKAFTLRVRAQAGLQIRNLEAFVGYDWLRVGGADLHGPMAGLRLTF
jgi:hypothetical protein